jgi:hypothetical protein
MNNLISARHKEIIICLSIIILVLVVFVLKICSDKDSIDPRISKSNLNNFVNLLLDPTQNTHGIMILAPNRHNNLVVLNKNLVPVEPCYNKPGEVISDLNKRPIEVPPECTKDNIQVEKNEQIIVLTPATKLRDDEKSTSGEYGKKVNTPTNNSQISILFVQDTDRNVTKLCKNADGTACPPYH